MTAAPTPTRTSSGPKPEKSGGRPQRGRLVRIVLVATGLTLAFVWIALLFTEFRQGSIVDGAWVYVHDDLWGYDFEAYLNAAFRLTSEGTPYQKELLGGPFEPGPEGLYYYAPPLAITLLPAAGLAVADSSVLWFALHVMALAGACAVMPVRPFIRISAFAVVALSYSFASDVLLGNVSVLLLFPMAVAWRWLDRPIGSIALAVAISVRPTMGIFMIWQLLRRRWQALAWVLGAGLVLVLLTLPFVGLDGYRDYLTVLRNFNLPTGFPDNRDFGTTALVLGASESISSVARMASVAIAVVAILLSLRRDREVGFMVTLGASLLLVPMLWDHYLVAFMLPAAFLAQRVRSVAILLPLLAWLPPMLLPLVVVLVMLLPLLVSDADAREESQDTPQLGAATRQQTSAS